MLTYAFTNTKNKITKVRIRNWPTVKLPVILGPHRGNSLRALSVDVEISWTRTTGTIIPHARWYVLQTHGREGPLLASITDTQTLALLFFLTTTDAEEVKDKRMASGVQFMKNIEPSEEESAGIEKNRGEVASSWLFPTCVA